MLNLLPCAMAVNCPRKDHPGRCLFEMCFCPGQLGHLPLWDTLLPEVQAIWHASAYRLLQKLILG